MFYIFIKDNKINGCGQCKQLSDGVINFEVNEELYRIFEEIPDKYIWDGENIVENPNYEKIQNEKKREQILQLSLTKREVFLALYKAKGITPDQLKAQITEPQALIEFEYANEYYRGNPLIDLIGQKLGFDSDDLDYLFQNKELPTKEKTDDSLV